MPANFERSNSANMAQAQVDIQNSDGGRSDAWNARRLAQGFLTHSLQLLANLARQARYPVKAERSRNGPPLGILEPRDLPFLLRDIAVVFDLGFNGREQPARGFLAQSLPHPSADLPDRRLGPLEPLPVPMPPQR